jgi:hypothetical protein
MPFLQKRSTYLAYVERKAKEAFAEGSILSILPRNRIRGDVDSILETAKTYCQNLADYYDSKGYKRITLKPEEEKHIEWAVLAQVGGHNYLAIADEYETDAANVRKFVLKYLALINLPIREGLVGAGRPVGVIEKYPRGSR